MWRLNVRALRDSTKWVVSARRREDVKISLMPSLFSDLLPPIFCTVPHFCYVRLFFSSLNPLNQKSENDSSDYHCDFDENFSGNDLSPSQLGTFQTTSSIHCDRDNLQQIGLQNRGCFNEKVNCDDNTVDVVHCQSDEIVGLSIVSDPSLVNNENARREVQDIDREQLENILSVLQSSIDTPLESSLEALSLTLSEEFVMRVTQTPHIPAENLILFLKWTLKQSNFTLSIRGVSCFVHAIGTDCSKKQACTLWELIKEIAEGKKGLITTHLLNDLIRMLWKLSQGRVALEVFNNFENLGCRPNDKTYYYTFWALTKVSLFDDAWDICEKLLNSASLPSIRKIGKMVESLCRGGRANEAHLLYLVAKEQNKCPPQSVVNFLVENLCRVDQKVHLAQEMLKDFAAEARRHAIKSFSIVLRALARIKDVQAARSLLLEMVEAGPPPGNEAFNIVICAHSKSGNVDDAVSLKKAMENRGLRPDVYTYSVIMSAYAKSGQMDDARKLFLEAKTVHSKLCRVIYHILIRGYCKLENFEKALECLREMREDSIEPNRDEYNKLIQSLCLKALDWQTAEVLSEEMKQKGMHLTGITRGLIKAVKALEDEALQVATSAEN